MIAPSLSMVASAATDAELARDALRASLWALSAKGVVLVLLLYALRTFRDVPRPQDPVRHSINLLGVVLLLGLGGCLLAAFAVGDGSYDPVRLLVSALALMALYLTISMRHLYLPIKEAALVTLVFALTSVVAWHLMLSATFTTYQWLRVLEQWSFLGMLAFVVVLLWWAVLHNHVPISDGRAERPVEPRNARVWEVWVNAAILAAVAMYANSVL